MIVIVALAIGVVFNSSSSSFSQSQMELLEEGQRLNAELSKFLNGGRYADAIPLAQRLLTISEKTLAPNDPTVVMSLNILASLYERQGRYTDAEPLYKRSLAIREKALGPDHPDVAFSLNNLAVLYNKQGRDANSEPLYKRSLAIREKALGSNHLDVAQSLNNLASLYQSQDRYADAENALSGLARAFFYAGAKSLVVSHWEVDSEATVALMDGLFEALKDNPRLSHAEALRMSMLRMIANSSEPELAQPKGSAEVLGAVRRRWRTSKAVTPVARQWTNDIGGSCHGSSEGNQNCRGRACRHTSVRRSCSIGAEPF